MVLSNVDAGSDATSKVLRYLERRKYLIFTLLKYVAKDFLNY